MKKHRFDFFVWVAVYQVIFIFLHYLYDWFPGGFTKIIGGINESIYQHMKLGFFSAVIMIILEYFISARKTVCLAPFLYSRLLLCAMLPLLMFIIYYISPLVFVEIESLAGEIVFANIALIATSVSSLVIARRLERTEPDLPYIIVVLCLFFISIAQYIVFTERLPWFDVFAVPPGW